MKLSAIYYVEWEDARGVHQEWTDLEVLASMDTCMCYSVGKLIREDKQQIVLVPHWGNDPQNGCGEMIIPKSAIRKKRKLR